MASILSRLSSLVPDFRSVRSPAARPAPRRPAPDQGERLPARHGGGDVARRVWFLPYADSATEDSAEIRAAMRLMIRDPYVKAGWLSQVLTVLSQAFQVRPPEGDRSKAAQEQADFVRHALEKVDGGMAGVGLAVLMNLGADGYSVAEKVWTTEGRGRWANKIRLQALKAKDCDQAGDADGRLIGDTFNNVTGVESTRTNDVFPISDFTFVRYLHLYDEPMGMSAFRASYGAYWSRDTVRKLRIIHKEKMMDGLLMGTYTDPADKPSLEAALERARSSTWLSVPEGVRVESLTKSQATESDYKAFDESLAQEILTGVALAHLHILQGGVSDARGDTKVHKAVSDLGPWLLTYLVETVLNQQVIPDLIDFNFPAASDYPRVSLGGVTNQEVLEILQVLQGAQQAGFKPSKAYYATALNIQEADPTDPADQLTPAQPGGMGGGMGGFGPPPGGDPFGGLPPTPAPPTPTDPAGAGLAPPAAFNEVERFAWSDWKQVDGGKWRSPGGRTLSDPVFQRLKGAGGGTPTAPAPAAAPPQAAQPAAPPEPKVAFEQAAGDVKQAAAPFVQARRPETLAALRTGWERAAEPGTNPRFHARLGAMVQEAAAAPTPEAVESGFHRVARWVASLPAKLAGLACKALWNLAKTVVGNVAHNTYQGLIAPPVEWAKKAYHTIPGGLGYLATLAAGAGLMAASVAVPVLLPAGLAVKLGVAAATVPAAAAGVTFGIKYPLNYFGKKATAQFAEPVGHDLTALAGADGRRAVDLMRKAQDAGRDVLAGLTERAVARLLADRDPLGATVLFDDDEMEQLRASLAAVTSTADLLGRSRVRRLAHHAEQVERFAEKKDAVIEAVLGSLTPFADKHLDGLRVSYHPDGPKVWVDQMDWHDGEAGKAVIAAAKSALGVADAVDVGGSADVGGKGVYVCNEGPKPPGGGWVDLVKNGTVVRRDGTFAEQLAGLSEYKCPHCGGKAYNGDPKDGTRFRGSGHCVDCGKGFSVVGLKLQPVRQFTENVTGPDPFDVFAEPPDALAPDKAAEYFRGLVPTLGVDPKRYGPLWNRHAFTLAAAADQVLLEKVKRIVSDQLERGNRPQAVADIQAELDDAGVTPRNPSYASMVYRTNMNDAYHQGFAAELADPAMRELFPVWQYQIVDDDRTGDDHRPKGGLFYPATASFAEVRGPRIFNCVLPGQFVQGRVLGGLKARYAGKVIEVQTAGGRRLSVTPNHPVLTTRGFVPAGQLKEGDHAVCYHRELQVAVLDVHDQHLPARIEDVFEAVKVLRNGSGETPVSNLDLHGDAAFVEGQVEVVRADRELSDDDAAGRFQGDPQTNLPRAGVTLAEEARDCPLPLDLGRVGHPATGGVSGGDLTRAGRSAHAGPLQTLGGGSSADGDAGRLQSSADGGTADAERIGQLLLRLTRSVPADHPGRRGIGQEHQALCLGGAARLDARRPQPAGDGLPLDAQFAAELRGRFPGLVAADEIVQIRRWHYDGPVYDMETDVGYYVADRDMVAGGIIISNCRCSSQPVTRTQWAEAQRRGARLEERW